MQALESATSNPAKFLGRFGNSGTVEQGKSADLVLLNANPLEDIHNTRQISAVILRGRIVRSEAHP
jgi:imidazolonepropionase-like amidohydrolase